MAWRALGAVLLLGAILPAGAVAQLPGQNVVNFRAVGMDVTLRFREDRMRQMESQLRPLVTSGLERYTEAFGGRPRGSDGQPLAQLTIYVLSDAVGGAESDVGTVRLLVGRQPAFGFQDWRFVLLHELFHLWNPGSFRSAGPEAEWFSEGAAEFYALQTAARLGHADDVTAVRNAATMVGYYVSAPGIERVSLTEAGQQVGPHHSLLHHGGFTAVLVLDRSIRGRSANARSMDDVMRWLFSNFDREQRRYTTMDLARGVREAGGYDAAELFARSIMGRLPVAVGPVASLGELARALHGARGGDPAAPVDSLLLASLGIRR